MPTASQIQAHRRKLIAAGGNPFQAAPVPDPPERVAGLADEITFLRSRGFTVTSAGKSLPGFWKVDQQIRSTGWVRDKVAALKARSIRNAPEPVALTGDAPLAIVSAVAPMPEPKAVAEPEAVKRGPGKPPVDYRGLGEAAILEVLRGLRPHFASDARLAAALGEWSNLLPAVFRGDRRVTAKIVAALYGPEGATLLPRWADLLNSQVPSESPPTSCPPVEDAAPAAQEVAAGDGAAASEEITETGNGASDLAAETLAEEITKTAAPGVAEAGSDTPSFARATAAAEGAGEAPGAPASDLSDLAELRIEGSPDVDEIDLLPPPVRRLVGRVVSMPATDSELLVVLRGKASAIEAQLAAADARREALFAELAQLQAESLELQQRQDALQRAIEIFAGEEVADG